MLHTRNAAVADMLVNSTTSVSYLQLVLSWVWQSSQKL